MTVSTGGVITGLNFVPGAATTMTSPTSVPLHLLALEQAAQPGTFTDLAVGGDSAARVTSDAELRAAIVNVAGYYLRLAKTRTPAQMEALIWDNTSSDGADHGASCAAFASLTLELAAQAVGQQSWVTGGETYPWPMPEWADVRVDTNPASPGITSVVADAQAHGRWHPRGDGYQPQPGDWAVYDGHVEVVTSYAGGVLDTIGADSLPGLTVNAHSSGAPLADQGVAGFVDNGNTTQAAGAAGARHREAGAGGDRPEGGAVPSQRDRGARRDPWCPRHRGAAWPAPRGSGDQFRSGRRVRQPGLRCEHPGARRDRRGRGDRRARGDRRGNRGGRRSRSGSRRERPRRAGGASSRHAGHAAAPSTPGTPAATPKAAPAASHPAPAPSAQPTQAAPSSSAGRQYTTPGARDQQAFISLVAPGAVAAQQRFGVPAAVTIAQAIEESAWGRSGLAAQYHNLFGIKGTGPAGSVGLPTSEYEGGQWVTVDAQFRVYHNDAESIADHAELLATSGYYTRAMADRAVPDAFANDLTGVYATDPDYGANLIALMKLYNLYQFDTAGGPRPRHPRPRRPQRRHRHRHRHASPAATPSGNVAASPAPAATGNQPSGPAPSATGNPASTPASGQAGTSAPAAGRIPGLVSPAVSPAAHAGPGQDDPARGDPAQFGTGRAGRGHQYQHQHGHGHKHGHGTHRGAAPPRCPGWSRAPGSSPRRASPGHQAPTGRPGTGRSSRTP